MRHARLRDRRPFWQTLRDAGFVLIVVMLFGLIALVLGVAIGLRWFG